MKNLSFKELFIQELNTSEMLNRNGGCTYVERINLWNLSDGGSDLESHQALIALAKLLFHCGNASHREEVRSYS